MIPGAWNYWMRRIVRLVLLPLIIGIIVGVVVLIIKHYLG